MVRLQLDGYKVVVLLLFTLIGLFLGVISFTSFGVLNEINKPLALLNTALDKLEHIQKHQDEVDVQNKDWRNMMVNDHLFLSGMTALKKAEIDMIAKRLGINVTGLALNINGSQFLLGENLSVPIPPSAIHLFNNQKNLLVPLTPSLYNSLQ